MTGARLLGIGAVAPGIDSWADAMAARADTASDPFRAPPADAVAPPKPAILDARERRRAGVTVLLAMAAALEACGDAELAPDSLPAVFASWHGEGTTTHRLMDALTEPDPLVSPTLFHNSVHNTPAGYWSIATGNRRSATSLSAGPATFHAGLTKAITLIGQGSGNGDGNPVLLVSYDVPFPEPLHACCPLPYPLAVAFVLGPEDCGQGHGLIALEPGGTSTSAAGGGRFDPGWAAHPLFAGLALADLAAQDLSGPLPAAGDGWPAFTYRSDP